PARTLLPYTTLFRSGMGTDFDQHARSGAGWHPDAVSGPDRLARVAPPVGGIGLRAVTKDRAGQVRHEWNSWRLMGNLRCATLELVQNRVEKRRVKRMRDLELATRDARSRQFGQHILQRRCIARKHGLFGTVDRRDRQYLRPAGDV